MSDSFQHLMRFTSLISAIESSKDAVAYLLQFKNAMSRIYRMRLLSGLDERESLQAMNDVANSMIDDLFDGVDEYQSELDKMVQ